MISLTSAAKAIKPKRKNKVMLLSNQASCWHPKIPKAIVCPSLLRFIWGSERTWGNSPSVCWVRKPDNLPFHGTPSENIAKVSVKDQESTFGLGLSPEHDFLCICHSVGDLSLINRKYFLCFFLKAEITSICSALENKHGWVESKDGGDIWFSLHLNTNLTILQFPNQCMSQNTNVLQNSNFSGFRNAVLQTSNMSKKMNMLCIESTYIGGNCFAEMCTQWYLGWST